MGQENILIVEDDRDIARLIRYNLEKDGFSCRVASSGEEALRVLKGQAVDLVILDIMLPHIDGFEVCRRLRQGEETSGIPIIILTAKSEEIDKVVGFELGADDYMVKPFSPRELLARVKAVLRRTKGSGEETGVKRIGDLKIDLSRITVERKDKALELTAKEFELLRVLLQARGRVLSREYLLNHVWGMDQALDIQTRTVDVHIRTLRKKLKGEARRIVTVKNYGYRLEA